MHWQLDVTFREDINHTLDKTVAQNQNIIRKWCLSIEQFSSTADSIKLGNEMFEYWMASSIFRESKEFFEKCPVLIYIVSNIDRDDILKAIEFHGLKTADIIWAIDISAGCIIFLKLIYDKCMNEQSTNNL